MMYLSESLGALTGIGVATLIALSWPEAEFMTVEEMRVVGDEMIVSRSIQGGLDGETVADWVVTVVGADRREPTCQTETGRNLHEGWSVYDDGPSQDRVFPIDVWVGDVGCVARLRPGNYSMFVTWTPRDGRKPVTARTTFTR